MNKASVPEFFIRFKWPRRLEHLATAASFAILAVSGLAQSYHQSAWSQLVISTLGGIDMTRLIHRYAGLFFSILLIQHILVSLSLVLSGRWRASMVINKKDFEDTYQNVRYYLGLSDQPARCDRYDYKQKFEYWGVMLGGLFMVVTGFLLWFPVTFFEVLPFAPGQLIPAAKAGHSNEAMLAFLIIVIWHIYNSVFSPEVFPLDTSIFTGKISRERLMHEHPIEFERLTGVKSPSHDATMEGEETRPQAAAG